MASKRAPSHLTAEAKRWWRLIIDDYDIDDPGGLLLVQTGLEAFDRLRLAQKAIADEGQMIADRFGQMKPHPLLTTERDARAQMIAALRALNLDLEPLREKPGRPNGR